ncbi:hypothetical protein AB5I41_08630 [Sphingomonas sp. MMS24-JH45]
MDFRLTCRSPARRHAGAGNPIDIELSDYTPACGALMAEMIAATFPADLVTVVEGGLLLARCLLRSAGTICCTPAAPRLRPRGGGGGGADPFPSRSNSAANVRHPHPRRLHRRERGDAINEAHQERQLVHLGRRYGAGAGAPRSSASSRSPPSGSGARRRIIRAARIAHPHHLATSTASPR